MVGITRLAACPILNTSRDGAQSAYVVSLFSSLEIVCSVFLTIIFMVAVTTTSSFVAGPLVFTFMVDTALNAASWHQLQYQCMSFSKARAHLPNEPGRFITCDASFDDIPHTGNGHPSYLSGVPWPYLKSSGGTIFLSCWLSVSSMQSKEDFESICLADPDLRIELHWPVSSTFLPLDHQVKRLPTVYLFFPVLLQFYHE